MMRGLPDALGGIAFMVNTITAYPFGVKKYVLNLYLFFYRA